jgi:hypothetical protein
VKPYLKTTAYISFFTALLQFSIAAPVLAATDKKIVSSTVCQGVTPEDRANLRYNGSSLEAVGASVDVVCAIVRDSTESRMNYIEARFLRPAAGAGDRLTGTVHSCEGQDGGCEKKEAKTDDGNNWTSTAVDTRGLPHSSSHYFTYRVTLFEGWKLVYIHYQEEV